MPLPTPQERRRREVMLARLMLLATDIVLSGEPLGLKRKTSMTPDAFLDTFTGSIYCDLQARPKRPSDEFSLVSPGTKIPGQVNVDSRFDT